ncbi:MAG: S1 RNA-binding domain-containing protein [Bacteroidota bacterium]
MIKLGQTNTLTIIRDTPVGLFLGEDEHDVVLLPKKFIESGFDVGNKIEVFIYKDSNDRIIATRLKPYVEVNNFAFLNVSDTNQFGAFLDWGLEKDLFVPFKEQKKKMETGRNYVVYVYIDELTDRIVASSKVNKFISNEKLEVEQADEVNLMVYDETPLGFTCIINGIHKGLIYHNEIFQDVMVGDELQGYIKTIREGNLIDLSLQKIGFKNVLSSTDVILEFLKANEGFMPFTDKSSPDIIERKFKMSKSTFKKTIGILYRQRKVSLEENGVKLIDGNK